MGTFTAEQPGAFWSLRNAGAALLDFATASHRRAVTFLVLVSLVSFIPGFFNIPPIDRDETRFAQATKQMIESGDYVDIRFQDEVRYKKPVGIYWMQAAFVRAGEALGIPQARTTIWLYRMPSLLAAIGAVLLTYWTGLALGSRRAAYLAGVMLACSILLGIEARLAKTDAMLLLTTLAAMGALARVYLRKPDDAVGWRMPALFWTAIAAGVLIKGPLIIMVIGLAVVTLAVTDRSARWLLALRPAFGVLWLAALVLPWFVAIIGRSGETFFVESVGQDLLSKVFSGQEAHGAPPLFYLLLFWLTFWPGAPLAAMAAPDVWANRRVPEIRFLLAWLVPSWIVFELVITKLPHYVLPLYPAIAILTAWTIEHGTLSKVRWVVRSTVQWPVFAAIPAIAAIAGLIILRHQLGLVAWLLAGLSVIFGFFAWRLYESDGAARSLARAAVSAQLMSVTVFGIVLPLLLPLFPSAMLERMLNTDCENPSFAAVGYHEPSLVFLLGTSVHLIDASRAADFLKGGSCRFAFVEARQERAFAKRAEAIGLLYGQGPRFEAINYNGGRWITIAVYRSEAR
ncbi:MAG TPA: glycosyltransferase family 39 protein [Xanthobacteraceae bacterium]|jgi:4-amino-4-deoxy-L-arabinose transferase-like glycosyltransferase|nr:glycosyltransferase family 39 protein [Xanthobacteraceae bacterium]